MTPLSMKNQANYPLIPVRADLIVVSVHAGKREG
jgi:hypothetical protein